MARRPISNAVQTTGLSTPDELSPGETSSCPKFLSVLGFRLFPANSKREQKPLIRRSCRTIKHIVLAIVLLVGVVCCAEVAWRVYSVSEGRTEVAQEIPLIPNHATYHQLQPAGTLSMTAADGTEKISIQLNSFGLRGPEPALVKAPERLRVVCLGDELVFGPGLSDGDLFTAKLQLHLQRALPVEVEVINAGVPGYCPLLSLLQYRHTLRALKPDIVIQTFDMSDVADDHAVRAFAKLDESGVPMICENPALKADDRLKSIERHFQTLRWAKCQIAAWKSSPGQESFEDISRTVGRYAWIRESPPDWEMYIENALEPIGQLQELSRESAAIFVFSAFPAPWQVSEEATGDQRTRQKFGIAPGVKYTNREPFERLANYAQEHQLEFLDVSQFIDQVGNPEDLYQTDAPWLTARGHEVYAAMLAGRLVPRLQERLRYYRPANAAGPTAQNPESNIPR